MNETSRQSGGPKQPSPRLWSIVPRPEREILGEGLLWSPRDQAIYWVDILRPAVRRMSLADGTFREWLMPEPIGWLVERANRPGFIAGMKSGFAELSLDPYRLDVFARPEQHLPGNRMNDGAADPAGRIWAGTMDMAEDKASGALYRLDPDRSWRVMDKGYKVPNGPVFSADGQTMYHSDTARRIVYRSALSPDGAIMRRETFLTFAEDQGHPDGMTVDADGGLWIAHWGGSRVSRFVQDGSLDRSIALPALQITNVVFAGAGLDRMFVTSAALGLPPSDHDGALFEVDSGQRGIPPHFFRG